MDYFLKNEINLDKIMKVKEFINKINKDDETKALELKIEKGGKFYNKINEHIIHTEFCIKDIRNKINNIEKLQHNYISHKFKTII